MTGTTTVDGKRCRSSSPTRRASARRRSARRSSAHYFLGADSQGRDVMARLLYGGRTSLEVVDRRGAADLADRDLARARRRLLRRLGRRDHLALPRHPVGVPGLPAGDRALDRPAPAGREDRAGQRRPGVAVAADHHHRRRLCALRRAAGARRGVLDPPPRVHGGRDRGRREGPAADPRRDAAERAAGGARVAAADDRHEHRHRGGALVSLDRRPGAQRELGDDRRGRPEPALHAAVGVDRAGRADRDHRARAQRARRRRARRARPARLAAHPAPHATGGVET